MMQKRRMIRQDCRGCGKKLRKKDLKFRDSGEHRDDALCIKCKGK